MNNFYGVTRRPAHVPEKIKATQRKTRVCSPNKTCRGQLPYTTAEGIKWQFVYWDGTTDQGIEQVCNTLVYQGDTYCWYSEA